MGKKIAYGMVGGTLNAFIGEVHRKAIAFDPRVELAAGCFSTNAQKNAETGEAYSLDSGRVYQDYREMAEAESKRPDGISFVSITTPNNTHYEIAKCFLEHGIHVACEKPLCFTIEQAEELAKITRDKGLLFAVTYTYTGYTMVKVMREMIKDGKIGNILSVNAEYAQEWLIDELDEANAGTSKLSGWRSDPNVSGIANCVGDIGTHIECTVHYVTGLEIKRLLATTNNFGKALDMNDNMIVEYDNGANGAYWCSQVAAGKMNGLLIRVYGTIGSLEWEQHYPDYLRFTPKGEAPQTLSRGCGFVTEEAGQNNRLPSGHPEGLYVAFANIYRNFATAVIKKKAGEALTEKDLDFPTVENGLSGVKFVHAVVESGKKDAAWVTL